MLNEILLVIAALLPAIILCVYVFKLDKVDKEPRGLLLRLFLAGALCCFPASYIEGALFEVIDALFSGFMTVASDGRVLIGENAFYIYTFIKFLIGVSVVEEGLKWISLRYITRDDSNFNCLFDGMIYSVFVSLGFAALENILYVLNNGWINAFMRAVLSVPGHMFFAVMMGYYYSFRIIGEKAAKEEKRLIEEGVIAGGKKPFTTFRVRLLSLVVPVTAHTIYNFSCSIDSWWATALFYAFVIFMYRYCFAKLRDMSELDAAHDEYVAVLLEDKYPELCNIER